MRHTDSGGLLGGSLASIDGDWLQVLPCTSLIVFLFPTKEMERDRVALAVDVYFAEINFRRPKKRRGDFGIFDLRVNLGASL